MRSATVVLLIFYSFISFAHRGDFLAINEVQIKETKKSFIYDFKVENINMVEVRDIKIEIVINRKSVFQKYYPVLKADFKFFNESFEIPKSRVNPERDYVQIEITEIFGKKDDWGGWDSPNMLRQVNTLASEFYVDAPWRMKKTYNDGTQRGIPIHFFLHDADKVIGFDIKIDYINIQVKNASGTNFSNVLHYENIPDADYRNMFTCKSISDPGISVKEFDINSFNPASDKTIVFDAESDFLDEYVSIDDTYWYFTFNIPAYELVGMDDVVDVKVQISYANLTIIDENFGVRIFRSDDDLPKIQDYYRGDTHLHSMYTQNDAEIGLPLCSTKEAAKLIGLDWITTTDHTSDFDNYGDGNIHNNWDRIQIEVGHLNSQDPSMIYIAGQEVAANNHEDKLIHMLAYPSEADPFSLPFLGDGDGDIYETSVSVDNALNQLHSVDGFAFAAHPYATEDKLPLVPVDGGIWNLGHPGFAVNGDNFPKTGGGLICNDPSASSDILTTEAGKLIKDALKGSQIWNHRASLSVGGTSGDELDAWGVQGGITPLSQADTTSYGFHLKKFRQGQEIVNYINQLGLALKNQDSTYKNWKMFFSGGSDAHGSFNFSNTGNFAGFGGIDDNAVGKINTLVYCPEGPGDNGTNILKGLREGNITMSDGPILTLGISDDGNNYSNEIIMGQDTIVNLLKLDDYYLNFNYTTTQEFGAVSYVKFIVGTQNGEQVMNLSLDSLNGNQIISYKLSEILDSILGIGNTPELEYFYLRAEMQTYKDYTANSNIYMTDFGLYHSVSNPIWIKLKEIKEITATDFELQVYPNPLFDPNFNLVIFHPGINNVTINIYNDIAQLIFSKMFYVEEKRTIPLKELNLTLAKGVYTIQGLTELESTWLKFVKL